MRTKTEEKKCPDPVMKYCQGCKYGYIKYPDWVETREDLEGCCFETFCTIGMENYKPTKKEERQFHREWKRHERLHKRLQRRRAKRDDSHLPI